MVTRPDLHQQTSAIFLTLFGMTEAFSESRFFMLSSAFCALPSWTKPMMALMMKMPRQKLKIEMRKLPQNKDLEILQCHSALDPAYARSSASPLTEQSRQFIDGLPSSNS